MWDYFYNEERLIRQSIKALGDCPNSDEISRSQFTSLYSWAIPSEEALDAIKLYSPVIEIGAGTGYWAMLLQNRGVDILAFDARPPGPGNKNGYHKPITYTEVRRGGQGTLSRYPTRTLFLCWPPYDTPMAADCLRRYSGANLIYIGESYGGCTGDDTFHDQLEKEWEISQQVQIPSWPGFHDEMVIYKRK